MDEAIGLKSKSHPSSSLGHLWIKSMILKFLERFFVLWEEQSAVRFDNYTLSGLKSFPANLIFFIPPTPADDTKTDSFVESHGPSFIQNWINTNNHLVFLQSQRDASQMSDHSILQLHSGTRVLSVSPHISSSIISSMSQGHLCLAPPYFQKQEATWSSSWSIAPIILHLVTSFLLDAAIVASLFFFINCQAPSVSLLTSFSSKSDGSSDSLFHLHHATIFLVYSFERSTSGFTLVTSSCTIMLIWGLPRSMR
jgi:hypothetical protein